MSYIIDKIRKEWMLKAENQAPHIEVFNYVINNKGRMTETSPSYAIEKKSSELKETAMTK